MHSDSDGVAQAALLAAVGQAADGIVIVDTDGRIRYVNPAFTGLTGYTSEEAVGQLPSILKSGLHAGEFYDELWNTIRSGRTWSGEIVNRRKDGTFYREEMEISPVRSPDAEISGYIAIKRDITARRAAEDAQSFLASIVESSDDAIVAFTPAGTVLSWNHSAETMFGYSEAEMIGNAYAQIVVPERLSKLPLFIDQIMGGAAVPPYETVCRRRDEGRIHVSVAGSPIRNSSGAVFAVSVIIRDISERKRREEILSESEERFRIMADGCPAIMWVTDSQGGNQFINRAYRELLGAPYEDVEGHRWQLALHPEDAPAYIEAFRRAVCDQAPFAAETRVRRADGEWRWLASFAEPRISSEGKFLGHVGLSPDITERRRTEDTLRYQYSLIHAIHEASPDGILVVNEENRIVSHNRKFLEVWRIPLSDISANQPDAPILAAAMERVKDPDSFLARIRQVNDDPDANDHREIELLDGRTLERYSTALRREGEGDQGRVWFFRDITERKEAARQLQRSEENFRQLAENIREVFWMRDIAAEKILYVSPAYEQIWGQKCESLYADPGNWRKSVYPDDLAAAQETFGRFVQGEMLENEYRIVQPGGDVRWIRDRGFPVRDAAGNIVRLAGVAEDITERKISELRLIHQGLHDDLTGLPNRRYFGEKLAEAIECASADDEAGTSTPDGIGAVFFIDLDQFKLVNDTLGHCAGDELLRSVAHRWRSLGCATRSLARFGGDEFALVATGLRDVEGVRLLGESLLGCLDEPFRIAGQEVFVGASIGISVFPKDGTEPAALIKAADVALHEAKRQGKGQLRFFAAELAGAARGRLELDTRLRRAVTQAEFKLQFQPQFVSGQLHPRRFEALIRWYPPDGPPVPPLDFIPIAEQNGLIVPIGTWVLQEACRRCADWQEGELRGVGVAVNVSAPQFACTDFVGMVTRALETTGLSPRLLEIEITESVFLADMNAPVRALRKLRQLGVTIALDDFGTGYSSLSYLQSLPLDALKIDRSFLARSEGRPRGVALLSCVVEMAHVNGLRVIAEGVETVAERDLLESLGCDEMQGYLLGAPSFNLAGIADDSESRMWTDPKCPWRSFAETRLAGEGNNVVSLGDSLRG